MAVTVAFSDDPFWVLTEARACLVAEPVRHNLILTLLHERVSRPEAGRYWIAYDGGAVAGVVFQSPVTFPAIVTSMGPEAIGNVVETIVSAGVVLPGVSGEAEAASRFAGQWTESTGAAASPELGMRMYEMTELVEGESCNGRLRNADGSDRDLILGWLRGFAADTGEHDPKEGLVDARLAAGQYWIWEDGEPVSMASATTPVEGASRIGAVYTPPDLRRRGYAEGCVRELSRHLYADGVRCMLYTDLGNPTSNSIYRRIGYRAVAEVLRYRFD